jgi:hypothetical protein
MSLKTDEDLNEMLESTKSSQDKFFKPGKHELTILSSTDITKGDHPPSDPDWLKVEVKFEGVGGKTITDYLLVPMRDLTNYKTKDGKTSNRPGARLVQFLKALGADVSIGKLGQTLTTYFSKDNSLVGLNVAAEMAYTGNHTKYLGKDADDQRVLTIVDRNENRIDGVPTFSDYESLNKYAADNKIPVKGFVDIVRYVPSTTPNKVVNANW